MPADRIQMTLRQNVGTDLCVTTFIYVCLCLRAICNKYKVFMLIANYIMQNLGCRSSMYEC